MSGRIKMAHGAGGTIMQSFLKEYILKYIKTERAKIEIGIEELDDSAAVNDIVFTTDSHTPKPIFFPGGDIGSLSVAGTINDISVMGAKPIALSCAMVIEEGFPFEDLEKILCSMEETSKLADVPIITGDTKVVEKNALEEILITTSALGQRSTELENNIKEIRKYRKFEHKWLRDANLAKGDKIIVSGGVGEHGIALLSFREGYGFESVIKSDVYPLNKLIDSALKEGGIAAMKDPTRGGLANTLNEWSEKSSIGILIDEEQIPIKEGVRSACELLGIDPLEIGNEGKVVMAVVKEKADDVLSVLRGREEGKEAEIIGEVREDINGVVMRTLIGGKRMIEMPIGDPVPRIC